jgi:hypothetical protein
MRTVTNRSPAPAEPSIGSGASSRNALDRTPQAGAVAMPPQLISLAETIPAAAAGDLDHARLKVAIRIPGDLPCV